MINMKKKNRILIAGLMAIAVTGASTLAYFTSDVTIKSNGDNSEALKLDITNGTVKITGEIGDGKASTPNWSYDVARKSGATDKDRSPDIDLNGKAEGKGWINTAKDDQDKEIDAKGEGTTSSAADDKKIKRVTIGTPVTGAISNARPGDAFVLGQAVEGGSGTNAGLTIKNESTLTTKIDMGLSGTTTDDQKATFEALNNAGFKLYVGSIDSATNKPNNDIALIADASELQTKINGILGDSLAPGHSVGIYVRIELPLITENTYKEKKITGTSNAVTVNNFDLSKLFTIKATQENNPHWNEDGTN